MKFNQKQRSNVADFFRELAVAIITVGAVSGLFTQQFSASIVPQFSLAILVGMAFLIISLQVIQS